MQFTYTPQSSPDDPEEFGLELAGPGGLGKRFIHLERSQLQSLLFSGDVALQESDLANGRLPVIG